MEHQGSDHVRESSHDLYTDFWDPCWRLFQKIRKRGNWHPTEVPQKQWQSPVKESKISSFDSLYFGQNSASKTRVNLASFFVSLQSVCWSFTVTLSWTRHQQMNMDVPKFREPPWRPFRSFCAGGSQHDTDTSVFDPLFTIIPLEIVTIFPRNGRSLKRGSCDILFHPNGLVRLLSHTPKFLTNV